MKVLLVSDANSIHTYRWATSLSSRGVDVVLFSITGKTCRDYGCSSVRVFCVDMFGYKKKGGPMKPFSAAMCHIMAVRSLKKLIADEKPDILHAHYATSYALVAALTGFHPFIVSVWGSDVYEFPRKSSINRKSVEFVLGRADRVLSTSRAMAEEARRYMKGDNIQIGITPFGVDVSLFSPEEGVAVSDGKNGNGFVFGTVKTLSRKYGIDLLVRAFASVCADAGDMRLSLVIAGGGPDRDSLEQLACGLGCRDKVVFTGPVEHSRLPELYSSFDAAVFLSREESFGVSAVEAMSCGCPVIVSDTVGFNEVIDGGRYGMLVPVEDHEAAAEAMKRIMSDRNGRERLSVLGRQRVEELYDWNDNVSDMISEYGKILEGRK